MNNKQLHIGLGAALLALTLASCQGDELLTDAATDSRTITIGGTVGTADSRAQIALGNDDTSAETFMWNAGDTFTLYDLGTDGTTVPTEGDTFTISSDYSDDAPSASAQFTGETGTATGHAIAAIYPAQSSMPGITSDMQCELCSVNLSADMGSNSDAQIASYLSGSMLMYATGTMNGDQTSLTFRHLTAMIRVTLANASESPLSVSSLRVGGDGTYFAYNAVCSLVDGDVSHTYTDETDVLTQTFEGLTVAAADTTDFYLLFVPATTFTDEGAITFTLNDSLSVSVPTALISTDAFRAGYRYRYSLTLADDGLYRTADYNADPEGYIDGHEYVDLGLSVMWATVNMGAESPTDYGDYYAWGETSTKSTYTGTNSTTYGVTFNGGIAGNADYDAARANWGGTWRLPTYAEIQELVNNCTWTWGSTDGITGYTVTSNETGNSIFLPAAGRYESSLRNGGTGGYYWASTPYDDSSQYSAYCMRFASTYHNTTWSTRSYGFSIRPMTDMTEGEEEITEDDDTTTGGTSGNATIIETTDGDKLLITAVGDYHTYEYDSNGYLTSYYLGEDKYTVTNNGTTFKYSGGYETITYTITLNEDGYIAKGVYNYKWTGKSGTETVTETGNYTYDSSGHLISATYNSTEVYTNYTSSYVYIYTLTWEDDLLTKLVYDDTSDSTNAIIDTYTFSYGNNAYKNTYKQYVPAIWDEYSEYLIGNGLSYIGLQGLGPAYLPTSFTCTEYYYNGKTAYYEDWDAAFKYGLNSNGTVSYQSYSDGTGKYAYSYTTFTGTTTRAATTTDEDEVSTHTEEPAAPRSPFRRRHHRRSAAQE